MSRNITLKADSLAEAYAMAFEEVGSEFDVLEIKKVSSGAFGGTSIQIKVTPVVRSNNTMAQQMPMSMNKKKVEKSNVQKLSASHKNKGNSGFGGASVRENFILWEDVVLIFRDQGFSEQAIVKILSEIKASGKHLKLDPISLVEERLRYYCLKETRQEKVINVLFADTKKTSHEGVSAYLFSHYAKQGLSSNKILLTNSLLDLKRVLGAKFLKILKVEILEVKNSQQWLESSSVILSQNEVCCVYFQKRGPQLPPIPDAMGSIQYTHLMSWSDRLSEQDLVFLNRCKAQLMIKGSSKNLNGSLLKASILFEIPTNFILKGKEFLSGLVPVTELITEVIDSMKEFSKQRKAG